MTTTKRTASTTATSSVTKRPATRSLPRGIRNCNPGNIRHTRRRWQGEVEGSDPAFKTFESMAWGCRAIFLLLDNYRRLHGCTTIRTMISRWAPPFENHTERYIEQVAQLVGVGADEPIDTRSRQVMLPMVAAIIRVENGRSVALRSIEQGWELFLEGAHE